MSGQPPSKELEQSEHAPASSPPQADQVPAKRKASEELQHNRRPPTKPGTLPFMWNLPTTPSLPILYADSKPLDSDDELAETKKRLHEAEKKIFALTEDNDLGTKGFSSWAEKIEAQRANIESTTGEFESNKDRIEREAQELIDKYGSNKEEEDKYQLCFDELEELESVVTYHRDLVHEALDEIDNECGGPDGRGDYKPGQLPLFIMDKYMMDLGGSVDELNRLVYDLWEDERVRRS